jgi:hypothetical protein
MQVIDLESPDAGWLKVLLYGAPGTGKTNFGVSAPKALILLSEAQAIPNIKAAMVRLGVRPVGVLHMTSIGDYVAVQKAFKGDPSKPFTIRFDPTDPKDPSTARVVELAEWPETVVIDSLTEVCGLIKQAIRAESPPKLGKDNLPVDSERFWNVMEERSTRFIKSWRDVPRHVVFICLIDDRIVGEGDEAHREVKPDLPMRKLPAIASAAVNVVGVTYRRNIVDAVNGAVSLEYGINTIAPEYVLTKPFPPIPGNARPDMRRWIEVIHGAVDTSQVVAAPMTSAADLGSSPTKEAKEEEEPADKPARQPRAPRPRRDRASAPAAEPEKESVAPEDTQHVGDAGEKASA